MRVDAHELAHALGIGDHVVDRDLGCGAGGDGNGDDRRTGVLRGRGALERAHILELGVRDDDTDGLGGIHGGAAADGDDAVRSARLESLDTMLHVLDGGIRLDIGKTS